MNAGFSIHCHHDTMVEFCWDLDGRVAFIKANKPIHEQATRLRLFKLLPQEAIDELPAAFNKSRDDWTKANADLLKARAGWAEMIYNKKANGAKAGNDFVKTIFAVEKLTTGWIEALAAWPQESKAAWHKKWCGCSEWDGKEVVFLAKTAS